MFISGLHTFWHFSFCIRANGTILPQIHTYFNEDSNKKRPTRIKRTGLSLSIALAIHNLPEGMAVGIVCAGWMYGDEKISFMGSLALSIGIAIQNFPEGAIVSIPLLAEGVPKGKTFLYGVLSGIVEPIGSLLVIV